MLWLEPIADFLCPLTGRMFDFWIDYDYWYKLYILFNIFMTVVYGQVLHLFVPA